MQRKGNNEFYLRIRMENVYTEMKSFRRKNRICNKEIKKKPPCWVKWNYNIFLERVKVLSKS
jgi:hypothetical protein